MSGPKSEQAAILDAALAIGLMVCRTINELASLEISLAIQVVPLVLSVAVFAWLRVNPFAVDVGIPLQGAEI